MTSAEKLGQAVDSAIVMADVDADAVPHVVLHGWAEVFQRRERVLRAIVEELGITEAMVDTDDADLFDGFHHGDMIAEVRGLARPLRALLEAAGDEG